MPRWLVTTFKSGRKSHVSLAEVADIEGLEEARVEAARRIGSLLNQHAKQQAAQGARQSREQRSRVRRDERRARRLPCSLQPADVEPSFV